VLTSQMVKDFARQTAKVDLVGIANIERFKDAPRDMDPLQVMPRARSVIVIANRIPRGCYRGIDEGTHWASYSIFGYAHLSARLGRAAYKVSRFVENYGYEAASTSMSATSREWGARGPAAAPGKPARDVTVHLRIAATLAGLGEIGWSKVFLTPEFGPRQRLNIILTEAELEPDPIRTGHLCDRCKRCVAECPGGALPKDASVGIEVEGHRIEWADIDLGKCKLTHFGLNRKNGQFMAKRFPGLYLPIAEQEVAWKEAWDVGWAMFPSVPYFSEISKRGVPALCGARGCIVGCMKHMEKVGRVENQFHGRPVFSEEPPWALPEKPSPATHHGFIYDPDADTEKNAATKPGSTWY
jgi:ferredoxin